MTQSHRVVRAIADEDDDDSPAKCRQRRRRRIEMRRRALLASSSHSQSQLELSDRVVKEGKRVRDTTEEGSSPPPPRPAFSGEVVVEEVPVYGTLSVAGRSRDMEDSIAVQTMLCSPEINWWRSVHYFGVFDGHGGSHVAALCSEKMHVLLAEELSHVTCTATANGGVTSGGGGGGGGDDSSSEDAVMEMKWREIMFRTFHRMDELASKSCACGSFGFSCECHPVEAALGGSTAVVAVLTPEHIVVANCGDSRAVLCRGGKAIPLSRDHKPDRSDELARIKSAGGQVIYLDGARVDGILAMSRAIGDRYLKPAVTSEPEVTFTKRDKGDECLILASDGLWDVISNEMACEVARECLQEERRPTSVDLNSGTQAVDDDSGALYPSRSALAAALLTRLALARQSSDNISVIVINLKSSTKMMYSQHNHGSGGQSGKIETSEED